jgi:transposase
MSYRNDQSKKSATAFDQASTLVAVVELSRDSWLVAGVVPGISRHPLKKLGADENGLLARLRLRPTSRVECPVHSRRLGLAHRRIVHDGQIATWLAKSVSYSLRGYRP